MRDNVNKPERILILAGLLVNFRIEKSTKYCIKTIPQKNRRVCSSSVCSSIIQRKEIISAVAAFIATSRCHVILHAINVIAALYKCSASLMSPPSPRLGQCASTLSEFTMMSATYGLLICTDGRFTQTQSTGSSKGINNIL